MKKLILLLLLSGCTNQANLDLVTNPTYREHVRPVFLKRCSSCHGGVESVLTHPFAKKNAEKILDRVVYKKNMPPGGFMPQSERDLIERWYKNGAPR
jgi:uncharacterized membrane protein